MVTLLGNLWEHSMHGAYVFFPERSNLIRWVFKKSMSIYWKGSTEYLQNWGNRLFWIGLLQVQETTHVRNSVFAVRWATGAFFCHLRNLGVILGYKWMHLCYCHGVHTFYTANCFTPGLCDMIWSSYRLAENAHLCAGGKVYGDFCRWLALIWVE